MISIIIVNYNRKDLLKNCLDSVKAQGLKDIETIVVDNGSSDGSAELVKISYPEFKLIQNKENLFFCRANNQGIEASNGDFILCLNSDCALDRDYLKEAVSSFSLDDKIGMVSGKLLRMDKKTMDSTGLFVGRNRKAVERGYGKLDKGWYNKPGYVFGVSGACMLMRKAMLEDVKDENGYFDETFEIYYEDLDLCWRAQKKGWRAYYNPNAIVYHERGATAVVEGRHCEAPIYRGRSNLNRLLRRFPSLRSGLRAPRNDIFRGISEELKKKYIRNRYKCMRKNDSLKGILLNLPFILLYEIKIYCYILGNFLLTSIKRHSIIRVRP